MKARLSMLSRAASSTRDIKGLLVGSEIPLYILWFEWQLDEFSQQECGSSDRSIISPC